MTPLEQAQQMTDEESCDHDWRVVNDSFDHEFGTEQIVYQRCVKCDAERTHEPYEGPE